MDDLTRTLALMFMPGSSFVTQFDAGSLRLGGHIRNGADLHDECASSGYECARRLSRGGMASFQTDLAGLSDSMNAADDPDELTQAFTVDRKAEFAAVADLVFASRLRNTALQALCSVAYHMLQAAVPDRCASPLLRVYLLLPNLLCKKHGPDLEKHACARRKSLGVRRLLISGEDKSGLRPLDLHFGPKDDDLRVLGLHVVFQAELDHDLTRPKMTCLRAHEMMTFPR